MNFFSWKQAAPEETTSLLGDWQSYNNSAKDIEAGSSGALLKSVEATGSSVGNKVSELFSSVSNTVSSTVKGGVASLPATESFRYSIPTGQQLMLFFCLLAAGGVFLLLAFTIFLPVIILAPAKFAFSFTLGCLCIMAGFSSLRGWKQQLAHMLSKERIPFSAAYVGSIVATLWAALIMKSYLLSLLCSGLQMVALLYYILSYFPGGAQGVKFMLTMFANAVASCFGALMKR